MFMKSWEATRNRNDRKLKEDAWYDTCHSKSQVWRDETEPGRTECMLHSFLP